MAIIEVEETDQDEYYKKLKEEDPERYEHERTLLIIEFAKNLILYYHLKKKLAKMRAKVDTRAPAARPHVAMKLKKARRELDRTDKVQHDNHAMLQRLNQIMQVNRLDNRWLKPLPNFHQKVGLFYDVEALNSKVTARSLLADESEESYHNVKCYACEMKKKQYNFGVAKPRPPQDFLPPIHRN